jgi:hypothetical protein
MVPHLLMLIAVMARRALLPKVVSVSRWKLHTSKHPKSRHEVAVSVVEGNVVSHEGDIAYSGVTASLDGVILDAAPGAAYNR